ncbi:MAG: hypothetical protein NTV54_13375 [Ignavibacteriales bacterium]|nr:hypothetical protein [Ignavibacteriales bacterium]
MKKVLCALFFSTVANIFSHIQDIAVIVMKFGGTSVESAEAIRRLTGIVSRDHRKKLIVLVSACSGVTNQLLSSTAIPHNYFRILFRSSPTS